MRILITTWGTDGDTWPVLALAQRLMAVGHETLVMADRAGEDLAASLGIPFEAMPGDFRALMESDSSMGQVASKGRSPITTWRDLARDFARPAITRILEHLDDDYDMLVGSSMCKIPAEVIAERRGIPTVGIDLSPLTPTREFPPSLIAINSLPAAANLPLYGAMNAAFALVRATMLRPLVPRHRSVRRRPVPQIGAWSPTLVPRPADWPEHKPLVAGEFRLEGAAPRVPDELRAFVEGGEPPVYIGLGSMAGADMRRFRRVAIEALDGRRAVFSAGWNAFTDEQLPDTVMPIGATDLEWLFARCCLLVHHCGAGTAHLAARSGRPSIAVPQMADQSFWGPQLQRIGLAPEPIDRDTVTVGEFRRRLDEALRLETRALDVAEAMTHEDGLAATVTVLEQQADRP